MISLQFLIPALVFAALAGRLAPDRARAGRPQETTCNRMDRP